MVDRTSLFTADESRRQQALHGFYIAGTAPEKLFDDLAALVAKLFGTPISLISLVSRDQVHFKAQAGLPGATAVPREDSLCSVVVLKSDTVVFENLQKSPCALVNPEVAQALELRFYAGSPLLDENGQAIGALCVIDHQPRTFTAQEKDLLQRLASVVMRTVELRLASIKDPSPTNLQLQLAFQSLQYAIDRITELLRRPRAGEGPVARGGDQNFEYRVVNEIIDYVDQFVGGSLQMRHN
ncbi:GAF domain-containing protein [Hymenobacter sp. NST-14]|uniref:GAF domain-containing protein n=1 Tax=Hymenobacter piscis TaxID=2839984 RepID=UPI001C03872B|nr:GAF domain-containing protein [Hymenobacter piscis]MBT9395359.1 GAF domain-containing protein [Hymenobacter piscis]